MAILHEPDYYKPSSLKEALELYSSNDKAAVLAGGTDLVTNMKEQIIAPEVLIDIKGLSELAEIKFSNDILSIGSLVTFTDLIESKIINENFPLIAETSKTVASVGIRNRATVAGNIASSVPCMDSGPMLRVYDAEVIAASIRGERKISIDDFFIAPRKTAMQKDEIITKIDIKKPKIKNAGCYVKLKRYQGEDLAQASVAILAFDNDSCNISFGSVAPTPIRAKVIEEIIKNVNVYNGEKFDDLIIEKAKDIIPSLISPITDLRASKEYRLHAIKIMFERGLKNAILRLNGGGEPYGASLL